MIQGGGITGPSTAPENGTVPIKIGRPGSGVYVVNSRTGSTVKVPGKDVKRDGSIPVPNDAQGGDELIIILDSPPPTSITVTIVATN